MTKVIIPHMPSVPGANECLKKCVKAIQDYVPNPRIFVITNEGMGYGAAVNLGIEIANVHSSDSFLIINNDVEILNDARLLTYFPYKYMYHVKTPRIFPPPRDNEPRSVFTIRGDVIIDLIKTDGFFYDPIFSEDGGYYWEDDDLIRRLRNKRKVIFHQKHVFAEHLNGGGLTAKSIDEQGWFDRNKERFERKWGPVGT